MEITLGVRRLCDEYRTTPATIAGDSALVLSSFVAVYSLFVIQNVPQSHPPANGEESPA